LTNKSIILYIVLVWVKWNSFRWRRRGRCPRWAPKGNYI